MKIAMLLCPWGAVSRRFIRAEVAGVALALGLAWGWPAPARAAEDVAAVKMIEILADEAISTLTVKSLAKEERASRFRELLKANFDVNTIAQWVLGRHWSQATAEQRTDYLKLFEDLLVVTYSDRFGRYAGERLTIVNAVSRPGEDTLVQTVLNHPETEALIKIDWRIRSRAGKLWIVDVVIEGVSMGQTQRSEFASAIRQNGGIDGFLGELRKRVSGDA